MYCLHLVAMIFCFSESTLKRELMNGTPNAGRTRESSCGNKIWVYPSTFQDVFAVAGDQIANSTLIRQLYEPLGARVVIKAIWRPTKLLVLLYVHWNNGSK